VVLHDATLRELARLRPGSFEDLRRVRGIGEKKLAEIGSRLLEAVESHARKVTSTAQPPADAASRVAKTP
jgi:ATP-dependent DNA helicase RecQ